MKLNELTDNQRAKFQWMEGAQESFDGRESCLLNALKEYVKSMGGFVYFPNEDFTQTVLVCDENYNDWRQDRWHEAYIHALKLNENNELMMFTEEVLCSVRVIWSEEEIKFNSPEEQWYELDWDCSNAYLHNLQRIVYYLTNEEMEDEQCK